MFRFFIVCLLAFSGMAFGQSIKKNADGSAQVFFKDGSSFRVHGSEVVQATISANTTSVTLDTELDVAGASLRLTAGHWRVHYSLPVRIENSHTSSQSIYARVRVTNSANSPYSGSASFAGSNTFNANGFPFTNAYFPVTRSVIIELPSPETIKLRLTCSKTDNASGGICRVIGTDIGIFTGADSDVLFYAERVK